MFSAQAFGAGFGSSADLVVSDSPATRDNGVRVTYLGTNGYQFEFGAAADGGRPGGEGGDVPLLRQSLRRVHLLAGPGARRRSGQRPAALAGARGAECGGGVGGRGRAEDVRRSERRKRAPNWSVENSRTAGDT